LRTALISDVHGNALALQTVCNELEREGIDRAVYLGDLVQGGPQPVECLELIENRGWPAVLGNADAFVLDPAAEEGSAEPVTEQQLEQRAWTRSRLSDAHAATIASWPLSVEVDLGHGRRLLAFHATPGSYHPLLLPTASAEEFAATLGPMDADLAAGGHTHTQFVRRLGSATFVNPGSTGFGFDFEQAEHGVALDAWASYAVVTTSPAGWAIDLRRTDFDPLPVASALRSCGMPHAEDRARRWEREPDVKLAR
jgi:predicted phosphodiesterase